MSLVNEFQKNNTTRSHRPVVEKWLHEAHKKDEDFLDFFIKYSQDPNNSRKYMYDFARDHGYEGGYTSMKVYMQDLREGRKNPREILSW